MSATEPPDAYPPGLERAWLALGEAAVGARGEEALERLRPSVARLSDLFTVGRPSAGFPDYLSEPSLLAAYGLFFFPQSWTRAGWAMAHASFRGWTPGRAAPRVLDLGSGPGSCGLRAARWLSAAGSPPGELHLLDRSASALGAAQAVATAAAPGWTVATRVGDAREPGGWPEGDFDLILAGFVLNELGLDDSGNEEWLGTAAGRLAPGGLIALIEPALRSTAEPLRRLSDRRAARKPRRIGPEVDGFPCPMLGGDHWDHEVRAWRAPETAQFLNRRLHRDLGSVRFSQALFSDAALPPLPTEAARVVAEPQLLKGMARLVLSAGGRLLTAEIPTRGLSRSESKSLVARFARGDIVSVPRFVPRATFAADEVTRLGP